MAIENEIHPIQVDILLILLFKTKLHFAELNKKKVSSDQFNFHLKELIKASLVEKTDNLYQLTPKGKEFANRFDTQNHIPEQQAKVSVLVCCNRYVKGKKYYLMQVRLKEPYYGFLGMITGKIRWGETAEDAGRRELKEESSLEGNLKFIGVEHKIDYDKNGQLLEDKFFHIFVVSKYRGNLKRKVEGGLNKWMTEEEIFNSGKTFDDANDVFGILKGNKIKFIERKFEVKKY